jgi:hypothetical protein
MRLMQTDSPLKHHPHALGLGLRDPGCNNGASVSGCFLLFPRKSVTLTFERMVDEALGHCGDFLRSLGCATTWANFDSGLRWPLRDFGPFDSRVTNP